MGRRARATRSGTGDGGVKTRVCPDHLLDRQPIDRLKASTAPWTELDPRGTVPRRRPADLLRARLLEQLELPVLGLGDRDRVAAREAGRAVALALGIADGGEHALVGEVGQAVRADAAADLVHGVARRDQLRLDGRVDPVVAGA